MTTQPQYSNTKIIFHEQDNNRFFELFNFYSISSLLRKCWAEGLRNKQIAGHGDISMVSNITNNVPTSDYYYNIEFMVRNLDNIDPPRSAIWESLPATLVPNPTQINNLPTFRFNNDELMHICYAANEIGIKKINIQIIRELNNNNDEKIILYLSNELYFPESKKRETLELFLRLLRIIPFPF